jgi:hypothetical protein
MKLVVGWEKVSEAADGKFLRIRVIALQNLSVLFRRTEELRILSDKQCEYRLF